jgi:hypothetical protein
MVGKLPAALGEKVFRQENPSSLRFRPETWRLLESCAAHFRALRPREQAGSGQVFAVASLRLAVFVTVAYSCIITVEVDSVELCYAAWFPSHSSPQFFTAPFCAGMRPRRRRKASRRQAVAAVAATASGRLRQSRGRSLPTVRNLTRRLASAFATAPSSNTSQWFLSDSTWSSGRPSR